MPQTPKLPEETWSINKEEKEIILDLGRELSKFIFDYAKRKELPTFHLKYVAGAYQYFMEVQRIKTNLLGEDLLITQAAIEHFGLGDKVEEPFQEPDPMVIPTKEEQIAALKKQIEDLEKPEVVADADIADAMISPEKKPTPMELPEEKQA